DSWTNRLVLIGGGVLAAGLLIFALLQFVNPVGKERDNKALAQNRKDADKTPSDKPATDKPATDKPATDKTATDKVEAVKDDSKAQGSAKDGDKSSGGDKKSADKSAAQIEDGKKQPETKEKTGDEWSADMPLAPPSDRQAAIGHLVALEKNEP